jgi:hypothetical protein
MVQNMPIKKIPSVLMLLLMILPPYYCDRNFVTETEQRRYPPDNAHKVTIQQGVWGDVLFWEGDFMPTVPPTPGGRIEPVIRDVYIYKATTKDQVRPRFSGSFYEEIDAELVKIIRSDVSGFYQTELDTGLYSFFVKEDTLFYANGFDSDGYIQPMRVLPDSVSNMQINITYRASW